MNRYIKGRITKGEFVSELFKQRVESLGGTYEANDCLVNNLNSLTDREFKDAKLILTPNGYLVDKLPTIKPNGGGDATVTRNTTKTRVNSSGLIESNAANVLAPDYLNGNCPVINVEGQATQRIDQSQNLKGSEWTGSNATITSIGSKIGLPFFKVDNAATNSRAVQSSIPLNTNTEYNISFFVDLDNTTSQFVYIFLLDTVVSLRLSDLTFNDNGSARIVSNSFEAKNYANNVVRFSFALNSNSDSSTGLLIGASTNPASTTTSIGEFGSFTGVQITEGQTITSYIPNLDTGLITRSADTVTVPIPAGTTEIIEKYEDGTTNTITTIPASPYTVPTGKRYEYILMR